MSGSLCSIPAFAPPKKRVPRKIGCTPVVAAEKVGREKDEKDGKPRNNQNIDSEKTLQLELMRLAKEAKAAKMVSS